MIFYIHSSFCIIVITTIAIVYSTLIMNAIVFLAISDYRDSILTIDSS